MKKTLSALLMGAFLSLVLVSCETASYYVQAAAGQLYILSHRENIQHLIDDPNTSVAFRDKLKTILAIRAFAEQELHLPVGNNYSTYVDVHRPYVVWNVFAAPEFSMEPVKWCYPIAGCVSYRGYFSEDRAQAFAEKLNNDGFDIYIGGVSAYSTLGWFSDSILNTVITRTDDELASLIFHELAHQLLYIPGETEFNESFATAVEQEGLKRWLALTLNSSDEVDNIVAAALLDRQRQEEFVALIAETVSALDNLYLAEASKDTLGESKQAIFSELKVQYEELKITWGGYEGYDLWFSHELNNAQLSTVVTYFNLVPAFEKILQSENYNLQLFYTRVKQLKEYSAVDRAELLSQ